VNFSDYRHDVVPLPMAVVQRMVSLGVAPDDRAAVFTLLNPLSLKGEGGHFHHLHCFRVGLLAADIAEFVGVDQRALLLAGLLHDVGKALVPAATLSATSCWTPADQKHMEGHVLDGFRLLRDRFDFTAQVIVWHHRFQARPYPEMPEPLHSYSPETLAKAREYGKLLMVADVYDALHRVNSSTGGRPLTPEEIRRHMESLQPELLGDLVPRLYDAKVLS